MTYFTLECSIISRQIIHSFEIGTLSLLNLLKLLIHENDELRWIKKEILVTCKLYTNVETSVIFGSCC